MTAHLLKEFDCDTPHRVMALFCSIFIQQNRMQTACEKIQTDMSMKQWLMLAMLEQCPEPKTLTNVGKLMGCSRQNIIDLTKRGKLHPIKTSEKSTLYLKSEILKRNWQ